MATTYCSWDTYEQTWQEHRKKGGLQDDKGAYLPDPTEIQERLRSIHWLSSVGMCDIIQDSVMYHDIPSIEVVRSLVKKYGATEASERLLRFLKD